MLKEIAGGSPAWKRGLESGRQIRRSEPRPPRFPRPLCRSGRLPDANRPGSRPLGRERRRTANLLDTSSAAQAMAARYYPDGKVPADVGRPHPGGLHQGAGRDRRARAVFRPRSPRSKRPTPIATRWRRWPHGEASWPSIRSRRRRAAGEASGTDAQRREVARRSRGSRHDRRARKRPTATPLPHVSLVLNTRSHTEESAGTRPVFVLAKDCCYAVDHVTGEPVWRRVIGLDSPFLPIERRHVGARPAAF